MALFKTKPARMLFLAAAASIIIASLFAIPRLFIQAEDRVALLLTDSPEILSAVELFNASQDTYLIEIAYTDDVARSIAGLTAKKTFTREPTFVIGRDIDSRIVSQKLVSLERLAITIKARELMYQSLLESGRLSGTLKSLPINFDLMLIARRQGSIARLEVVDDEDTQPAAADSMLIDMERIEALARKFISSETPGEKLAFSPRWPDYEFLPVWAYFLEAGFSENSGQGGQDAQASARASLSWSSRGLEQTVKAIARYVREINGSIEAEEAFTFRYLKAPGYKNLESGRILFSAMRASSFFLLPSVSRTGLEYQYFSSGESVLPIDVRKAGLLKQARGSAAAKAFLTWFFKPENQLSLLADSNARRFSESYFGIAGGFSSLKGITENSFITYYPELKGRLPPAEALVQPPAMPPGWEKLKNEFLEDWLSGAAGMREGVNVGDRFSEDLENYLDKARVVQ